MASKPRCPSWIMWGLGGQLCAIGLLLPASDLQVRGCCAGSVLPVTISPRLCHFAPSYNGENLRGMTVVREELATTTIHLSCAWLTICFQRAKEPLGKKILFLSCTCCPCSSNPVLADFFSLGRMEVCPWQMTLLGHVQELVCTQSVNTT